MTESQVAVIPGGTGSVGSCLVPKLLDRGFKVAVTYLLPDEATALEEKLDVDETRLIIRRVDAVDTNALTSFFQEASERFGPINVMASLVGGWSGGRDVSETDDVRLERMLDLNLKTAWNATKAALPHMSEDWGRIILMGSKHAQETPTGQAAYNMAKAGVVALAHSVAAELLDTETTCNALLPSVINTEATRAALPYSDYVKWPQPEEIAQVINFLASRESKVINGGAVPVWGSALI
ncbi:MAG: SDR family oxidoreductase [Actinomycetota bacterium]|nr:SDR family oxidoreductase [Actinomycetota bacterium]MDK1015902.1 SDR family oxidoreductase [Actinomycetota bacterium]MDK1025762.1 SDR family oxidoreductase [Actinomycetota bacterium]MDK1037429.1 SDR family oxidoreductase [Actinomycetota bacterium]MDK1096583.1 SDR family oxidoreductase [Actinomycetota bacterium]